MKEKTVAGSEIKMAELVLPNDTNLLGNLLGGRLLHWIDVAGALAATRHARNNVATVAIDSVEFNHPVKMGEMVVLTAKVIWTGNTSMQVTVNVEAENMHSGNVITTNRAWLTFVALDQDENPCKVPPIVPETKEEKSDYDEAGVRYENRKSK